MDRKGYTVLEKWTKQFPKIALTNNEKHLLTVLALRESRKGPFFVELLLKEGTVKNISYKNLRKAIKKLELHRLLETADKKRRPFNPYPQTKFFQLTLPAWIHFWSELAPVYHSKIMSQLITNQLKSRNIDPAIQLMVLPYFEEKTLAFYMGLDESFQLPLNRPEVFPEYLRDCCHYLSGNNLGKEYFVRASRYRAKKFALQLYWDLGITWDSMPKRTDYSSHRAFQYAVAGTVISRDNYRNRFSLVLKRDTKFIALMKEIESELQTSMEYLGQVPTSDADLSSKHQAPAVPEARRH